MRNIIILCDGTGNEISENISNVLKLYRCLRKTEKTQPRQLVYYDPGVGTLARPDPWHKLKQDFNAILGLATGYGLDDNVLAAYAFLVHNYQHGDAIYLFGFSRGAYTVRVLAGLIHKVGLIAPEQVNLAGSGLIAYKQFSSDEAPKLRADSKLLTETGDAEGPLPQTAFDNAAQFARITSARWPTIRFVGVWDTVASVIVPRPDRFYWPSLEELAFTIANPSVQTFRQAISIDERRCMFRLKKWDDPQTYKHNRFNDANAEPQDILQVWFAGVHADIGGGYPEKQSGLSKYPLLWMIDEATKCGLTVNQANVNQLAWGIQRKSRSSRAGTLFPSAQRIWSPSMLHTALSIPMAPIPCSRSIARWSTGPRLPAICPRITRARRLASSGFRNESADALSRRLRCHAFLRRSNRNRTIMRVTASGFCC